MESDMKLCTPLNDRISADIYDKPCLKKKGFGV